ncbi:MAG: fused MFS/spermidine synthase [Armatimonadetes bacterium]|nr:fused MFS/spermidine synthase [Armatimonadota bacterium]
MVLKSAAFVCGAVVMALELLGFRKLPPYFGSSFYVYGSLISTFLGALSLGYWLGGRLSDRYPSLRVLASLIFVSGLYTLTIPWLADIVSPYLSQQIPDVRWGSLSASVALFLAPGVLLGTVSPYILKLSTMNLAHVGNVSGTLYAISTCGSIFGTLLTSFYLIAVLPISRIILILGGVLMATALMLWVVSFRPRKASAVAPLLVGLLLAGRAAHSQGFASSQKVLHRQETMYHRIVVSQDSKWRYMSFDRSPQSGMLLKDIYYSVFRYTESFHLGLAYHPKAKSVLFIGLGGATGPKQFRKFYPEMNLDVAELDPAVVEISKRYFQWEEDARLKVIIQDGRVYIQQTPKKYDLIILDAYFADSVPFHLTTQEFFKAARERLTQDGLIIGNIIGSLKGNRSRFFRSEYKTLKRVFPEVAVFPVPEAEESASALREFARRNIMIFCLNKAQRLSREDLAQRAGKLKNARLPHLIQIARALLPPDKEPDTGRLPILSDEFAPVENLIQVRLENPEKFFR